MAQTPDPELTRVSWSFRQQSGLMGRVGFMQKRTIIIAGTAGFAAVAIAGTAAASQFGGDDSEGPITGDALVRASEVALDHTGEGRVTGTEVGDEDSYYEVEVTLDSGKQVDVQLDEEFNVVDTMDDIETPDDQD
jgi:hypothetical protein